MASVTPPEDPLAAPGRSGVLEVAPSRRGWRITAYAVVLVVLLAIIGWVSTHPHALPTSDLVIKAETPVAEPVYVGVFTTPADFDRTLHLSGVHVFATATSDVTITPHVCHGGSVSVTTTPASFCSSFGPTEGATLEPGDAIVLEVVGTEPTAISIDRVRIAYREGAQWATQDAGARSLVSVLAR